jgi:hypothetical protein
MLFRRNRFNKLKRTDIVNQIIEFESERDLIEKKMIEKSEVIQKLYVQGSQEKNIQTRQMLASKIKRLKQDGTVELKRLQFLNYNIQVLEKLKVSIDDAVFFKNSENKLINKALKDTKGLTDFLNKAYETRHQAEDTLIESNQIFDEYEESYRDISEIYSLSNEEDAILMEFDSGLFNKNDEEMSIDKDKKIDQNVPKEIL